MNEMVAWPSKHRFSPAFSLQHLLPLLDCHVWEFWVNSEFFFLGQKPGNMSFLGILPHSELSFLQFFGLRAVARDVFASVYRRASCSGK